MIALDLDRLPPHYLSGIPGTVIWVEPIEGTIEHQTFIYRYLPRPPVLSTLDVGRCTCSLATPVWVIDVRVSDSQ